MKAIHQRGTYSPFVILFTSFFLSLVLLQGTVQAQNFDLPGILDLKTLPAAVDGYAEKVLTCLHVPGQDQTQGQKDWLCERTANNRCIFDAVRNNPEPLTLEELDQNRTSACQTVYQQLLDKKYCSMQYGNCGEGAMVNYCLAHKAGQKDIAFCSSENDHAFSLFLKKGEAGKSDTICLMDRWPLGPDITEGKEGDESQYYFCNVTLVNGQIHYKGVPMEGREWYKKVTCKDWMSEFGPRKYRKFSDLDPQIWNEQYAVGKDFLNKNLICNLAGLPDDCQKKATYKKVSNQYQITFDFGEAGEEAMEKFHHALTVKIGSLEGLNVKIATEPGPENKMSVTVPTISSFIKLLD